MPQVTAAVFRRALAAGLVAGLALATSGCAYTMGEFGQQRASAGPAPASDNSAAGALPMKPATYVVDTTDVPLGGAPSASTGVTATSYPNMNAVPEAPKSKLLSPEEKAKVIADLEALARSQAVGLEKSRQDAAGKCGDAVKNALDPEAKLKSEAAGQGC